MSTLRRRCVAAFTAAELLVVLAIMGMIVLISSPALLDFYKATKVRTSAHRLASSLRLCRQVAVTRREVVVLVLEGAAAVPTYRAWVDLVPDLERTPADGEDWVVKPELQLPSQNVNITDVYNDTTPSDPDTPGDSVLDANQLVVTFRPDGQVLRMDAEGDAVETDTMLRIRMESLVSSRRLDRWDITINRVGRVGTDFRRIDPRT